MKVLTASNKRTVLFCIFLVVSWIVATFIHACVEYYFAAIVQRMLEPFFILWAVTFIVIDSAWSFACPNIPNLERSLLRETIGSHQFIMICVLTVVALFIAYELKRDQRMFAAIEFTSGIMLTAIILHGLTFYFLRRMKGVQKIYSWYYGPAAFGREYAVGPFLKTPADVRETSHPTHA